MKLSFVTPAYNAGKTVCRCLDSVIAQTDSEWELIVVDDGSIDNTYEIIKSYAEKDSRIIALTQKNQGPGIARNYAIEHTTGDYIAFLDSDDYIEPKYVESVKEKFKKDELDVVILDNYYEKPDGTLIRIEKLSSFAEFDKDALIAVQMTGKMPWGGWRKVIKANIIKDNGIEYSRDTVGEEALFSFRVFYHASKIGFLSKPVLHYVDYPTSQSKKGNDDPWGTVVTKLDDYVKNNIGKNAYIREINSFAYTALVVSLYRIGVNHRFKEAIQLSKIQIKKVGENYLYDCNKMSLEARVKMLLPFVRMRFVLPIVLFSKLKNRLK